MKKSIIFALTLSMAITVAFATGVQDTNGNAKNVTFNGELQQGKYVIGLSNSYFGNTWRKQMVETFSNAAEEAKKADYISNYQIQNGDGTVNAQIAQINRRGRRDYRLPGPGCTLLARCISRFPESQILWIRLMSVQGRLYRLSRLAAPLCLLCLLLLALDQLSGTAG